jgi:hypothetical protein
MKTNELIEALQDVHENKGSYRKRRESGGKAKLAESSTVAVERSQSERDENLSMLTSVSRGISGGGIANRTFGSEIKTHHSGFEIESNCRRETHV